MANKHDDSERTMEQNLESLLASGQVDDTVREGMAAFEAATTRIGNPTVMHFAPVTYSTTGNL